MESFAHLAAFAQSASVRLDERAGDGVRSETERGGGSLDIHGVGLGFDADPADEMARAKLEAFLDSTPRGCTPSR
jgi:hypothetical protein